MSDMNLAKDAKDTKDTEDVKDTNDKNGAADETDDWFIRRLRQSVLEARKNETWRDEYMTSRDIERRGQLQGEKAGVEKGIGIGVEKGRSEGRAEEKRKTVLRMLEKGMDPELISAVVELSPEELQNFVEEYEGRKA